VVELLNRANAQAIRNDFGKKTAGEDPVIHFYEHFLGAYNKELKVERGVFYTPQPVVSYIVRSVHELLQTEFGIEDGLADTSTWADVLKKHKDLKIPEGIKDPEIEPFVQILDPATGTATFLIEVIEVIHNTMTAKWDKERVSKTEQLKKWNVYVPIHLLPRLYAYELMMAPYAIAHMKVGLKLNETGFTAWDMIGKENRANIFLTNALEPWEKQMKLAGFDALAREAAAVNEIKRHKHFTVVIGNPPYAGHSSNTGDWISGILNDYYLLDGKPLNERNSKWLQDDYVKFTRLAQHCISSSGIGVLGFITNHGYIDNPTFRGMRQSLSAVFRKLCVMDLHGNSKKKEVSPDGSPDENVFDIQQGVAILLGTRNYQSSETIEHQHLFGHRDVKYSFLSKESVRSSKWNHVSAVQPFYLFYPQNNDLRQEYHEYVRMTEVMPVNVLGFQTHRDHFAIDFEESVIRKRMELFRSNELSDSEAKEHFQIKDGSGWEVNKMRTKLRAEKNWERYVTRCWYRPFDFRYCYYSGIAMDRTRRELVEHVFGKKNLCLNINRIVMTTAWKHAVVSNSPTSSVYCDLKDGSNVFPLWLYPEEEGLSFSLERRPNLNPSFLKALATALLLQQNSTYNLPVGLTPEDIFHYAYAVFHCSGYRSRYAEFLKIDFPRLPLIGNLELFRALAGLGAELTALHLLESPKLAQPNTEFIGGRHPEVEKISWSKNTVWIDKVQTTGFKGVREDVWNFHIGGYQVCEKWLKDRKGRKLSKEDIEHYQKIIVALSETIRLMSEIDKVIDEHGGWPGAFQTSR
jgi:predicted helicase